MMRAMRMCFVSVGLLLGLQALWMLVPQRAFGLGGCVPTPGVCHPSGAASCGSAIAGTDDCGGPCTVAGQARGACVAIQPIACGETGPGRDACGPCTASGKPAGPCLAGDRFIACGASGPGYDPVCKKTCTAYKDPGRCVPDRPIACGRKGPGRNACGQVCEADGPRADPKSCKAAEALACGTMGRGTDNCGSPCDVSGPPCPSPLVPYGFAVPGDKDYGFPNATEPEIIEGGGFFIRGGDGSFSLGGGSVGGAPAIPDPDTTDFLGLAAKGNVVIGDYTSDAFRKNALPHLTPGAKSKTQPYVIDPTDAPLGYLTGVGGTMYNEQGLPLFDGNYDQKDGGYKLDDTERKLYESSLSDADFQSQVNMSPGGHVRVDAVLFTNHALAGYVPGDLTVNGAMVSRDDGLVYSGTMTVNHDIRLLTGKTVEQSVLPVTIKRPKVVSWKDCSVSHCDD